MFEYLAMGAVCSFDSEKDRIILSNKLLEEENLWPVAIIRKDSPDFAPFSAGVPEENLNRMLGVILTVAFRKIYQE